MGLPDTAKQAVIELAPIILGGRIEKIRNLDARTFIVPIYRKKERHLLLLSVLKRSMRFHLLFETVCREYLYSSTTADVINRHLFGGRVKGVSLFDGGALLTVQRGRLFSLVVDFSAEDILLADEKGTVVVSLLRGGTSELSGLEEISRGVGEGQDPPAKANRALSEEFFEGRNERLRRDLNRVVRSEEKKTMRLVGKLREEDREAKDKERYRIWGEILKYNLEKVPRGASSVMLQDFDGSAVEIGLDPKLTPAQNMELFFKRYRKLKRRELGSEGRIEYETGRVDIIERLKKRAAGERLIGLQISPSLLQEAPEIGLLGRGFSRKIEGLLLDQEAKRKAAVEKRPPFIRLVTVSGKTVLIGRNADENEELVRRVARGNDLWFHAEGVSGSHVILRYEKRGGFTEGDVRDACMLALHFSRLREERIGSVVYTFSKWVKKPKGSKKGHVEYFKNKTKQVTLDDGVLTRLLKGG
jgi:predicted ribosome quality control (RQC) complex YloA/Tae2 family protein